MTPDVEIVDPAGIVEICRSLKEQGFERLSSVTAVDWHPREPRFDVVYLLHSIARNERRRLKCRLPERAEIDSVAGVWRAADWYEREVFDLFARQTSGAPPPRSNTGVVAPTTPAVATDSSPGNSPSQRP